MNAGHVCTGQNKRKNRVKRGFRATGQSILA